MRYGILSDAHGNIEALSVVLERLAEMRVDTYVFLGDAVGYGASPNEVCDRLRATANLAVLGNHDAAVAGRMDYTDYYDAARHALDWCARSLSPDNMAWLRSLPYTEGREDLRFCHGAPFDPPAFDYVFAADQVLGHAEAIAGLEPVTFVGHSHLTVSFRIEHEAVVPMITPRIECNPQTKYIITAGSVGQPRDRDPRACCGVYDSDERVFSYYRFEYDIHGARQKIIDAGLPTVFGDRLLVGV